MRLYAQQTWQRVMGTGGREAVAAHIKAVVEFYVAQSKANNHAVREAGCACIAGERRRRRVHSGPAGCCSCSGGGGRSTAAPICDTS